MQISTALKLLIGAEKEQSEIQIQFAFKAISELITNDEIHHQNMTMEEWKDKCDEYKCLMHVLYNDNKKYLKSIERK